MYIMTKTITKIGNSQGLMFDAALMDLARIKVEIGRASCRERV